MVLLLFKNSILELQASMLHLKTLGCTFQPSLMKSACLKLTLWGWPLLTLLCWGKYLSIRIRWSLWLTLTDASEARYKQRAVRNGTPLTSQRGSLQSQGQSFSLFFINSCFDTRLTWINWENLGIEPSRRGVLSNLQLTPGSHLQPAGNGNQQQHISQHHHLYHNHQGHVNYWRLT